jgi:hypothetical protein
MVVVRSCGPPAVSCGRVVVVFIVVFIAAGQDVLRMTDGARCAGAQPR